MWKLSLLMGILVALPLPATRDGFTSLGPDGGAVVGITVDPRDSTVLYASTTVGLFKTTDGTGTWAKSDSGITSPGVRQVVIDPRNPDTVYAATPAGVFKSTDAGASWRAVNSGFVDYPLAATNNVSAIAIDPHDSTVYRSACCMSGVFRSVDGGASWSYFTWTPGPTGENTSSLVVDPNNQSTVYAVHSIDSPGSSTVAKTTDAGVHWSQLPVPCCVNSLAIDPRNSRTLYASTCCAIGRAFFYKSTDGGATWIASGTGISLTSGQGPYNAIAIDATNPQRLYVAFYAAIYASADGAANWTKLDSAPSATIQVLGADPLSAGVVYTGTSNGVFRSADGGATWRAANTGLRARYVASLAIDPLNSAMLYVVATGSILKSTDRGVSWTPANTGMPLNVVGVAIDSKNSGTVFAAVTGGGNQTGGVFRSADGGMTWARSKVPRGGGVEGFAADPRDSSRLFAWNSQGFYASTDGAVTWSDFSNSTFAFGVIVDPHDSNTLYGLSYADQFRSVVKSVDGGVTWSGAGAGLPEYVISGLAVHPQDGQTVYAWSNRYSPPGPRFFKSADGGATWTPAVSGLQGNATVGFAMDPHNPANLFAATSGFDSAGVPVNAVWTSSDAGAHWVPFLPRTLDRLYIQGLVTDGSVLYALTSGGVYSIAVGGQ